LAHVVARNYGYFAQIPEHCYAVVFEFAVVVVVVVVAAVVVGLAEVEHEVVAEIARVVAEKADLATVDVDLLVEADIAAGHAEIEAAAALDTAVAAVSVPKSGLDIVATRCEADRVVVAALAADTVVAAVSVLDTVPAKDASVDAGLGIVADTALGTAKQWRDAL